MKCPTFFPFTLGRVTVHVPTGAPFVMGLTLPDDSEIPFVLPATGKDARGNPTSLHGSFIISVSDPAMLAVVQPDPSTPDVAASGVLSAVGPLGSAQVTFTDTGDSANPLIVIVDVQVIGGDTVSLDAPNFGNVRKQTPAPVVPTPVTP